MATLYIFEKGSVLQAARAILTQLDPDAVLVAASGNLYDTMLPDEIDPALADWRSNVDRVIAYDQIPIAAKGTAMSGRPKAEILDSIRQAATGCSLVVIATDDDREGDKIGWDIVEHCLKWAGPVKRMRPRAVTAEAIERAWRDAQIGDGGAVRSYCGALEARGRQHADWHIGINGTRQASVRLRPPGMKGAWNYGPVLVPTLAILADRENEIRNFRPRDYFKLRLDVANKDGLAISLIHDPDPRLFDRAAAEAIVTGLAAWPGGPISAATKPRRVAPPDLFNLDSLQLVAGRRLGLAPADTLKVAQELYDKGYISYPRGTGTFLPRDEAADASLVLVATTGHPALAAVSVRDPVIRPSTYRAEKRSGTGDAEGPAHYAVVPTGRKFDAGAVSSPAVSLYELIARRFIANHLADAQDEVSSLSVEIEGRRYSARGTIERERGWRVVEQPETKAVSKKAVDGDDHDSAGILPPFTDNESVRRTGSGTIATKTSAPRRITLAELPTVMAKLIDWVEDPALRAALDNGQDEAPKGLGTPATRSRIVENLLAAGYAEKVAAKGKTKDPALAVTEVGIAVVQAWRQAWDRHCDPVARAQTEHALSRIGSAGNKAAGEALLAEWKAAVRSEVEEMVAALRGAVAVVGLATPPMKPTTKMIEFAQRLAKEKGIALPDGAKADAKVCRAFFERHAPKNAHPNPPGTGPREPTEKQIALIRRLAGERRLEAPSDVFADAGKASAWIDQQLAAGRAKPVAGSSSLFSRK